MSHDQNYKNLILDYPREAIAFFAAEALAVDVGARTSRCAVLVQFGITETANGRSVVDEQRPLMVS